MLIPQEIACIPTVSAEPEEAMGGLWLAPPHLVKDCLLGYTDNFHVSLFGFCELRAYDRRDYAQAKKCASELNFFV